MGPFKKTIVEAVVLVVVGGAIASAANSLRSENSLSWSKNYFRKVVIPKLAIPPAASNDPADVEGSSNGVGLQGDDSGDNGTVADSANSKASDQSHKPSQDDDTTKLEHDFQEASFDDVLAAFNHPDKEIGLIVFVDARADEPYEEGRIPGAVQIDHYQLDRYLDDAMQFISAADKVYVYCNGGTCTDSISVCGDLYEYGIDLKSIFLYEGGWQEWSSKDDAPIETGPRRY